MNRYIPNSIYIQLHFIEKELVKLRNFKNIDFYNFSSSNIKLKIFIIRKMEIHFNIKIRQNQLLSFLLLISQSIVELATGNGKTFVLALAAVYFSLLYKKRKSIHIITFNDYLAQRDCKLLNKFYQIFNLSCCYLTNSSDSIKENISIVKTYPIIYTSIATLIFLEKYLPFKKSIILIDEIDNILLDQSISPCSISEEQEYNNIEKQNYYKLFKNFKIIYKLSIKLQPKIDYFFRDKTILFFNSTITKLQNYLFRFNIHMTIYDISLCKLALTVKHFYKLNIEYSIINNKIVFIDPSTGRYNFDIKFTPGINAYLINLHNITQTNLKSNIIYHNSILYFILQYKFISGVSGTIHSERQIIEALLNRYTYKVSNLLLLTSRYIFTNHYYKWIVNKIKFERKYTSLGSRPIIIVESNAHKAYKLYHYLRTQHFGKNVVLLNPNNEKEENEIINSAGKENSILISAVMISRGIDIKPGGQIINMSKDSTNKDSSDETKQLYNRLINKMSEISYKHINNKGGLLILSINLRSNVRIDLQIMGRTARNGANGEVIHIFPRYNEIYDEILGQEQAKLNLFHNLKDKYILNKMIELQTQKNFDAIDNVLEQLQNVYYIKLLQDDLKKQSIKPNLNHILFLLFNHSIIGDENLKIHYLKTMLSILK